MWSIEPCPVCRDELLIDPKCPCCQGLGRRPYEVWDNFCLYMTVRLDRPLFVSGPSAWRFIRGAALTPTIPADTIKTLLGWEQAPPPLRAAEWAAAPCLKEG